MLLNYLKITLRNLQRNKLHSCINIMGLSIGMACAILLYLYVQNELSVNRHHSKHDRIYMVQSIFRYGGKEIFSYRSSYPIGATLKDEYPVIEESVRTLTCGRIFFMDQKGEFIGVEYVCYADPEIFNVFDHKFIYGSPEGALDTPNSIVLSESLAKIFFGEQDPVGKILSRNNGVDYTVTGVFEDLPPINPIHPYSALMPWGDWGNSRDSCAFLHTVGLTFTYILLVENGEVESITDDYERFREKYISECGKRSDSDFDPVFQPLTDVYLYWKPLPDYPAIRLLRVYALSSLALLILIIACINYMNLATTRSVGRAREVGVRKALGADRSSLIRQFLCESIFITMVALLLALALVELFLPTFNNLTGMELIFGMIAEPVVFTGLLIITLIVGLIAGSYPTFFLSSFLPVNVLRGGTQSGTGRGMLRKLLVVVQFTIAIILIILTLLEYEQVDYLINMDLGFNKDDIVLITPRDPEAIKSIPAFKKEILRNSNILGVARSLNPVGLGLPKMEIRVEGSKGDLVDLYVAYSHVDFDFIDLMEIEVLEGRSFSREMGTDQTEAVLVNETLVKEMGWIDSPIGKRIKSGTRDGRVIGVLKDFHYEVSPVRLRSIIVFLQEKDTNDNAIYIKVRSKNSKETVEFIKKKWLELNPMHPFEYTFLEDSIADQYNPDNSAFRILSYSAFLSIFISCLGLYGLSSFVSERMTKEIGIRKVHGASVWNMLFHLSYNFIKLVLISILIAWPIAYCAWERIIEIYAYRPEMNCWFFFIAACIALAIALLTVSYHAVKAALTDPVKALRYE